MLVPKVNILFDNKIRFIGCVSMRLERDVENLSAGGDIELPLSAWLGNLTRSNLRINEVLKPGMTVSIEAGYLSRGITEIFRGYISTFNTTETVKITVEDEFYILRKLPVIISKKKTPINELVKEITGVSVSKDSLNFVVDGFNFKGNAASALARLKEEFNLSIYFNAAGELFVGGLLFQTGNIIKAEYGTHITKNNLNYKYKETNPLQVVVIGKGADGKEVKVLEGIEGGSVQTYHRYNITNEADLKVIAKEIYERNSFDGFEGSIEMFLYPLVIPGDTITYTNKNYEDRTGDYYVKGVTYTFAENSGLKQNIKLGNKL